MSQPGSPAAGPVAEDLTLSPSPEPHRSPLKRGFFGARKTSGPKKKGTKPQGPLWPYFWKGEKKNSAHFWAHCIPCEDNDVVPGTKVAGVHDHMAKHLRKCEFAPPEAKALAGGNEAAASTNGKAKAGKVSGQDAGNAPCSGTHASR